jgi:pimeloyl-ACP methyl ester carboxylesterase
VKKSTHWFALIAASMFVSTNCLADTHQFIGSPVEQTYSYSDGNGQPQQIVRSRYTIQEGTNSLNRFSMHRVRMQNGPYKGALFLMPGGNANFELYEIDKNFDGTPGNPNYLETFAAYFAKAGYDVYGYSPRTRGIPQGACTPLLGSLNCSPMADWGFDTIIRDAEFIRTQIALVHGSQKPVILGWSLGAMTTYAVLNQDPADYSGAVIWEGMIYSNNPQVKQNNAAFCSLYTLEESLGQYFEGTLDPALPVGTGAIAQAGISNLYAGGTVGAALLAITAIPNPTLKHTVLVQVTGLSQPTGYVPGYTLLAADALANNWIYADETILTNTLTQAFNVYESNAVDRDFECSLSGQTTRFSTHLGSFTGPVFAIRTEHGFGPYMDDNLNLLGTAAADRSEYYHAGFGHGDNFATTGHRDVLEIPILNWLTANQAKLFP